MLFVINFSINSITEELIHYPILSDVTELVKPDLSREE